MYNLLEENRVLSNSDLNVFFENLFSNKLDKMKNNLLIQAETVYMDFFKNLDYNRQILLLSKLANHRISTRHYDVALEYIRHGKNILQENEISHTERNAGLAVFSNLYGQYFRHVGQLDKAIDSFLLAISHDSKNIRYHCNIGATFAVAKKFVEADNYFTEAKTLIAKKEDVIGFDALDTQTKWHKYILFLNYGYMFGIKNDHNTASSNFEFAIEYAKENRLTDFSTSFGVNIYNLAFSMWRSNDFNKSLKYFIEALEFNLKEKNYKIAALCCMRINNLSITHTKKIESDLIPSAERLIKYAKNALIFAEKDKGKNLIQLILVENIEVYKFLDLKDNALDAYQKLSDLREGMILTLTQNNVEKVTESHKEINDLLKIKAVLINKQKEELIKTNSILKEVNYAIAHDLKEPARTIDIRINDLETGLQEKLSIDQKSEFNDLRDSMKIMIEMISNIPNIANDKYQKIEKNEKIDINEVIERIKKVLNSQIKDSNAVIKYEKLPAIIAKRGTIFQLFQNLISNAIKFNKSDSPKIEISSKNKDEQVYIYVKDNGIGISKENAVKIFDTHVKFDIEDKKEGTGLGLSICKDIVQLLDGEIFVDSYINEGSTFIIKLPRNIVIEN